MMTSSSVRRAAARMGSDAFLAPEILIDPFSVLPPCTISLSMILGVFYECVVVVVVLKFCNWEAGYTG